MGVLEAPTYYALGIALLALLLSFLLFQPTGLVKWLQKKNYQYEVTFALYMLTPTEKFIFNSVLFLTLSMFTLATIVYLPNHLLTISRRAYYYFVDDSQHHQLGGAASKAVVDFASAAAQTMGQARENAGLA